MLSPYSKLLLLLFVLILGIFHISSTTDYCNPSLCKTGGHIACGNDGTFGSNCSTDATILPMTAQLQQQIVEKHNALRNITASGALNPLPSAERMATMQWHPELAYLAELNVKQCEMKHDQCRNTEEFPYSGQNLATKTWIGYSFTVLEVAMSQVDAWFNEYKNTEAFQIEKYQSNGKSVGHFTAMVQDRSTHVGCAAMRQTMSNNWTRQLMACNYAYTNMLYAAVYASGQPASKCITGVNPSYRCLCSSNETY